MVAGMRTIGILNAGKLALAFSSWLRETNASKPPTKTSPSNLYLLNSYAMVPRSASSGVFLLVPISDPPIEVHPSTPSQSSVRTASCLASPVNPLCIAYGVWPREKQYVANEYTAEFIPPAGAPTLMIAIFLRCSTGREGSRKSAVFMAMKLCRCSTNSESRREMALAKSLLRIASATDLVSFTASTNGFLTILFSMMEIIGEGISGVPSKTASTAATPCMVARILS
ncbi:hypothetical protein OGAPHI_004024 [Ogataea philodendri]|uniref:Uncharacterized protein n=1 Tax=Ogataea philodendri TaxID=1378263 RepID=A0A9P8T4K8_9ASCO|nr:uncharacterized protein OGAPHI_004024 [Ogataea philodendri]KAH3665836.1 hypothetical protein OGAPHI_004024 [Ogataea philodendri]